MRNLFKLSPCVAVVNPKAIGLGIAAVIENIPEIVECHRMTGDFDYLLKISLRDLEHYDKVYQGLTVGVSGLPKEALFKLIVLNRFRRIWPFVF